MKGWWAWSQYEGVFGKDGEELGKTGENTPGSAQQPLFHNYHVGAFVSDYSSKRASLVPHPIPPSHRLRCCP